MIKNFHGKTAVITGAGSGFGREFARRGAQLGMNLVLVDIQKDALMAVADEVSKTAPGVIAQVVDVSKGAQMDALAIDAVKAFGKVHLLFNNAGVAAGGLMWEHSQADWEWVLGVNVWGVVHGVRAFVPGMIAHGEDGHIVNTASVAGLLSAPTMGVYNVSKHSVVALSETLYNDLRLVKSSISASVLCPAFVPTGIHLSERNRPIELSPGELTPSMVASQKASGKAVTSGKVSALEVSDLTFKAIEEDKFYIITHQKIMNSVALRLDDVREQRNPTDPFTYKPDVAYSAK
jgi:NADP-dependent 3-hydroxy acid dehydrogenase YdfG